LLSAGGLKISKPGFNVLGSISDSQVSFDSSWPKAQRILVRGSVSIGTGSGVQSVYYPRSLASVPTALILVTASTTWVSVGNVEGVLANGDMSAQVPFMTAAVYSDRIDLRKGGLAYTASYIVLIP
jgi:hypothetical protein